MHYDPTGASLSSFATVATPQGLAFGPDRLLYVTTTSDTLTAILDRNLNPVHAYVTRKIKATGKMDDLLKLLRRIDVFVLNDSEARQLTKEDNIIRAAEKIHRLGPKHVIVKKGEHGAILSSPGGLFVAPAFPLSQVVDPTGAGDSFVGGLIGYLASRKGAIETNLKRGMIYGSVVASFCCQGFGLKRTTRVTRAAIEQRVGQLEKMVRF